MSSSPMSSALENAIAASTHGDSEQAIALLRQAIQEQPESGLPHFLLGAEHASLGRMDLAEQCFANAVLLSPGLVVARYQLGLLQFSSGRASAALLTWQPLLGLEDESPLPHWIRGFAALAGDSFDTARACFEAGLVRNADHPPMSADIRKVLAQMDALLPGAHQSPQQAVPVAVPTLLAPQPDEDESSHVLLSNYLQQGPAH